MFSKAVTTFLFLFILTSQSFAELNFDKSAFIKKYLPMDSSEFKKCEPYGVKNYLHTAFVREFLTQNKLYFKSIQPTANVDVLAQSEIFGAPSTLEFIENVGQWTMATYNVKLVITALTLNQNYATDSHCGHSSGFAFDMRPLPAYVPNSWQDQNKNQYNREMNKQLILKLIMSPKVKQIYFNDPAILNDSDIVTALENIKSYKADFKYESYEHSYELDHKIIHVAHDNHLHVELYMPNEIMALDSIFDEIYNQL